MRRNTIGAVVASGLIPWLHSLPPIRSLLLFKGAARYPRGTNQYKDRWQGRGNGSENGSGESGNWKVVWANWFGRENEKRDRKAG